MESNTTLNAAQTGGQHTVLLANTQTHLVKPASFVLEVVSYVSYQHKVLPALTDLVDTTNMLFSCKGVAASDVQRPKQLQG